MDRRPLCSLRAWGFAAMAGAAALPGSADEPVTLDPAAVVALVEEP